MQATGVQVERVVKCILECPDMKKATLFCGPDLTIKATRPKKIRKNGGQDTIVLTLGKPNYAEREFIKQCKTAGERFPVRNIQFRWFKK